VILASAVSAREIPKKKFSMTAPVDRRQERICAKMRVSKTSVAAIPGQIKKVEKTDFQIA
jgi:hypothetical protein